MRFRRDFRVILTLLLVLREGGLSYPDGGGGGAARFLAAASRLDGFFAAAAGAGAGAAAASPTARDVMSTGATVALRMSAAGTAYSRSPSSCVEIQFQTPRDDGLEINFHTGSHIGDVVFVSR